MDESTVIDCISAAKDSDGLHPLNIGHMVLKGRKPNSVACTPKARQRLIRRGNRVTFAHHITQGCIELLKRSNIPIEGKRAVVLGRSNIVGVPVANLLLQVRRRGFVKVHLKPLINCL